MDGKITLVVLQTKMETKLKSSIEQIENINQAIRLTQRLRTHVCQIFRDIGDGVGEVAEGVVGNQEQQTQEQQKALLGSLRSSLETIGHDVGWVR